MRGMTVAITRLAAAWWVMRASSRQTFALRDLFHSAWRQFVTRWWQQRVGIEIKLRDRRSSRQLTEANPQRQTEDPVIARHPSPTGTFH
jgi:hypothetical protein